MLTNKQLGITQEERKALLKTREILLQGDVPHYETHTDTQADVKTPKRVLFDMSTSSSAYDCGTALCIGGFMKLFMLGAKPTREGHLRVTPYRENEIDNYVAEHCGAGRRGDRRIAALFYPPDAMSPWSDIKVEVAIKAIDNFLNTGDPDWSGAAGLA